MAESNPIVTFDEAYWWLNNPEAPYLRPPLHQLMDQFDQAEKLNDRQAIEKICQQFRDCEFHYLRSPIRETVEKLHNAVKTWIGRDIESACKRVKNCGGSYIRNPTYTYVLRMREAVARDPANARASLEQLYVMSRKLTDDLEAGETLVECGWALYKLQNPESALRLLHEANRRYNSYTQQIAVVYWMIGYVHWEMCQLSKAVEIWRKSISRFEKLASQRLNQSGAEIKWYREAVKRLNASIEYAIEHEMDPQLVVARPYEPSSRTPIPLTSLPTQPTPSKRQGERPTGRSTGSVTTLPEAQPIVTDIGDLIEAIPVLAEIPAGPWKQTRGDHNIIGQVTIDQVLINNEPHFVKNLRGGHIISLAAIDKHVVIKITGNSMNAAQPTPIEDGDYVLLRRQNTAQAGDIVVAKILDQATRNPLTTIKRFLIDGHPLLKAESNDTQYGTLDDEFKIDGLAVAVFKPVYKTPTIPDTDIEST